MSGLYTEISELIEALPKRTKITSADRLRAEMTDPAAVALLLDELKMCELWNIGKRFVFIFKRESEYAVNPFVSLKFKQKTTFQFESVDGELRVSDIGGVQVRLQVSGFRLPGTWLSFNRATYTLGDDGNTIVDAEVSKFGLKVGFRLSIPVEGAPSLLSVSAG